MGNANQLHHPAVKATIRRNMDEQSVDRTSEDLGRVTEGEDVSLADLAVTHEGFSGISLTTHLAYTFSAHGYLFRGQPEESWGLKPSIERLPELMRIARDDDAETLVLRAFARRAHHYVKSPPNDEEILEWLALMRHYGAPTRLLDWTASPYIAAFFAAAQAQQSSLPVIWAVHAGTLLHRAERMFHEAYPEDPDFLPTARLRGNDLFAKLRHYKEPPVVVPVRPFRFNERLALQQGWFLHANSPSLAFESSLKRVIQSIPKGPNSIIPLHRIKLTPGTNGDTLLELARMNITYETLFPGLEGFARSLETHLKTRTVMWTSHPEDWL